MEYLMLDVIKNILTVIIFTGMLLSGMFLLSIATHNGTFNSLLEWGTGLVVLMFIAIYTSKYLSIFLTKKIYTHFF